MEIEIVKLEDVHTSNLQPGDVYVIEDGRVFMLTDQVVEDLKRGVDLATGSYVGVGGAMVRRVTDAKLTGTA